MTVEIRELIIKTVVATESDEKEKEKSTDNNVLISEAVEQTMDILEKKKER